MKLATLYKAGTVKKALLAFASIGATGAVIKYKSHSQGQLEGQLEEEDGHGLTWYLKEALDVTSGSAREAGHSVLHLLHSLRRAWAGRYVAGTGCEGAGGGERHVSLPAAVAEFLSSMAEDPEGSRVGFVLAGYRVLDWLLDTAVAHPDSPEQRAVQHFLVKVLSDEEASVALLDRPGALPKLLRLVEAECLAEQRREADNSSGGGSIAARRVGEHARGSSGGGGEGGAGELRALLAGVVHRGEMPLKAQLDDVRAVMAMACTSPQPDVQLLAMQLLTALAQASVLNCTHIAAAGAGRRLAELAASSSTGVDVDGLQLELARLMTTLARNCPDPGGLNMHRWLYHLLCFAADAAANRNWPLAAASLAAFSNCLRAGSRLQESLFKSNALPLLHQLAAAKALAVGPSAPMRAAIANAVGALAESKGPRFPQEEREHWSEVLLGWMGEQPLEDALSHHELLKSLAAALAGLAAPAGPEGLHIAHAWLAELIVCLSRQVEAEQARRGAKRREPAAAAGGGSAGAAAGPAGGGGGSGYSWWRFWGGGSSGASGSGELEGAGARGQGLEGPVPGMGQEPSEEVAAVAEANAALAIEAAVPPAAGGGSGSGSSSSAGSTPAAGAAPVAAAPGEKGGWGGSWWWPWGGGRGEGAGAGPGGLSGSPAGLPRPVATSDSELSEFLKAAPVGPLYARSVAAELLEASGRVGTYQEPPPDAEDLMSPDAIAAYAKVAAAIDMEVADKALCGALKVLCALVSGDAEKQRWLRLVGLLPLLHRLTISHPRDIPEVTNPDYFNDALSLCVRRQAARLLAMLTSDPEGARAVRKGGWVPWLQNIAISTDCKVSSCAARALLHIESAFALQRGGGPGGVPRPWAMVKTIKRLPPLLPEQEPDTEGDVLEQAQQRLQAVRRRIDRQLDAVRPPVPPQLRLVMGDGVHLFDPLAPHHEVLAREGTASLSKDAPLVDIVFVHGIRGGAFATWRREGVLQRGQARENLERDTCWPGAWLAKEVPEARLLSIEYPAPASGWEGESFPLAHTAVRLMDKLAAAGVGQRPVIFVSHSMGGLVVKEILARAAQEREERFKRLASNARGAVFYSVPHFGAKLAAYGWQLRYVGGSPAAAVEHLRPGQHLDETNACVKAMYKSGQLPVLSFSEGQQTKLGYVKTSIVPHESAFPGYGEFVVLPQHDHINVCKPLDTSDPAYARLAAFLRARVGEVKEQVALEAATRMDHMEPAL